MLTKLFLLIVFHANVICTATDLDHFDRSEDFLNDRNVAFIGQVAPMWHSTQPSEDVIGGCAMECYTKKYICNSFIVMYNAAKQYECLKFGTSSSELNPQPSLPVSNMVIAVYNIRAQRTYSLKDISLDFRTKSGEESGEKWANDIVTKYGGRSVFGSQMTYFLVPLLLSCRDIVMKPIGSKVIRFEDTIPSNVKGQQKGRTENGEPMHKHRKTDQEARGRTPSQMITTNLGSWTVPSKRCSSQECLHFMALTFLQIFAGNICKDIIDIRHSNEPMKFFMLTAKDQQLLVGYPAVGVYIIIHGLGSGKLPPFGLGIYLDNLPQNLWNLYIAHYSQIFSAATTELLGYPSPISNFRISKDKSLEILTTKLVMAVAELVVMHPQQPRFAKSTSHAVAFFRDLMAIVVSDVYEKELITIQTSNDT